MEKNSNRIIVGLLVLIIGFSAGYFTRGGQNPSEGEHMMAGGQMMGNGGMGMSGAMDDMMAGLSGKEGDAFDQAFIEEMIVHHQGAVAMAQAALQRAKHQEIKQLAQNIITAQTSEIAQMQGWQKDWYGR